MSEKKRLYALVSGRVQGVSFRYHTQQAAIIIGVTGWVRNRQDRRVEVVAEGSPVQLDKLEKFLREGSPSARVDQLELTFSEATGEFSSFDITYLIR